jgi:NADH-quinone oxidoreductase subunit N
MSSNDLFVLLPLVVLIGWAILLLLAGLWISEKRKGFVALLAAIGLVAALVLTLLQVGRPPQVAFNSMIVRDGFTIFLNVIFLVSALAGVALAYDYLKRMGIERGEYYSLLLFSTAGMMLMSSAYDLIIVFLALELLSIPLYVLAGFARPRPESEEAALKYFLLGAFATGFVLYGVALIFAATAHTDLSGIISLVTLATQRVTSAAPLNHVLFLAGGAFFLVGFGFKIAAVPFHMWAPDVYQGAPSPVTGFMSVGAKVAGFAALLRVFILVFPSLTADLAPVLWGLAALTMIAGNILALAQKNIKRLLAYSSIANAGYLLMALVPYGNQQLAGQSVSAMLFFLAAYALTSLGAWAVVIALEQAEAQGLQVDEYAGLGRKSPWLALAMAVFMFSFTGVPPTLGFWGKFLLFKAVVDGGFTWLALIGLLTSLFSAYYYLRVVVVMYMRPGEPVVRHELWLGILAGTTAVLVVALALYPAPLLALAASAGIR